VTRDELVTVFRRWLYLPSPAPVLVLVAAVVANLMTGDPVWLVFVGPPACGKTELLSALSGLPYVHPVSTITEAGLLSGSISRDPRATGGLLAELRGFGIIVVKDLTSLLSKSQDALAVVLAALREVYDGAWVRRLGTGGGRALGWTGKAGLIGAVTETIDRFLTAIGAMGERFLLFRMAPLDSEGRNLQALAALANTGRQDEMRAELSRAVAAYINTLMIPTVPVLMPEATEQWLAGLADVAARCRSAVERDSRDREVEVVPQSEAPGRLASGLAQLMRAFDVMGVRDDLARELVAKVALDGMSKSRRAVVELLVTVGPATVFTTAQVGDAVALPTGAAARVLEDLAAHGVVERHSGYLGRQQGWNASA
jgi:hypothetical protein